MLNLPDTANTLHYCHYFTIVQKSIEYPRILVNFRNYQRKFTPIILVEETS